MKQTQPEIDHSDDSSLESESSAAVVSLYNSWSGSSDTESFVTQDDLSSPDLSPLTPEELLEELQKRCRPQDIPATPVFRPRTRPVCMFINFMGHRPALSSPPTTPLSSPVDSKSDLQFDDGDDYLAMIESHSTTLADHDFDEDDDLFDCIVQITKRPRYDESPLSPISVNEDDFLPL